MKTSDIISFSSFIVASLSFLVTFATIRLNYRHNKLSVKPIFKIVPYDAENYIAVFIKNAGTGPLLRQKLQCTNGTLTASCLIDLMPSHPTIKWTNFSKFEDFVIPANESETLIEIKGNSNNSDFIEYKNQIRRALKNITLECDFEDIYGQKFKSDKISLEYCYGRHFIK